MKFNKVNGEEKKTEMSSPLSEEDKTVQDSKVTVYLDMDQLQPNSKNEYRMTEIEKLSAMIKLAGGILQNIIVTPADASGKYTITTGERRWRAAMLLREKGEYPEELRNRVPCTIQDPQAIDLPLDADKKEDFSILVTNQYRSKTDGEKYMEFQKWKEIIRQLRSAGVKYLPSGYDDEESRVEIKGTPTRDLIAAQMGISTGQVSRYENVEKQGGADLIERLMNDELNLSEAEREIKERKQERQIDVSRDAVISDLEEIISGLGLKEEQFSMTEGAYKRYESAVKQLKRCLCYNNMRGK